MFKINNVQKKIQIPIKLIHYWLFRQFEYWNNIIINKYAIFIIKKFILFKYKYELKYSNIVKRIQYKKNISKLININIILYIN